MNTDFEMFKGNLKNKPEQANLPFKEDLVKLKEWRGFVPSGNADRFNEREELELDFDGKEGFFVEGKKVTANEFIQVLGNGAEILYNLRPDLKERFEKLFKKESD